MMGGPSVPRTIEMCEEAIRNRPHSPYVFIEFRTDLYHEIIKKVDLPLGLNSPLRGIHGEIVSQVAGMTLVKYNANDLMKNLLQYK